MYNLKFGVEIEYFGCKRINVCDTLIAKGINVEVQGYNHSTQSCWKIVTDCSVTCCGTGEARGSEIVSPILYGDNGLDELRIIVETLEECGAKVDKTCGLHVHHDANDFSAEDVKNIYRFMYNNSKVIDAMMPESRRGNSNQYCKQISKQEVNEIRNCSTIRQITGIIKSRYRTVNCQAYLRHGTIEFRQHSGTIDFEKIENWVLFTFLVMDYCKTHQITDTSANKNVIKQLDVMRKQLNIFGTDLSKYIGRRISSLNRELEIA